MLYGFPLDFTENILNCICNDDIDVGIALNNHNLLCYKYFKEIAFNFIVCILF